MKKNMATAMAAAMAFGAVVPAFANEVSTFGLTDNDAKLVTVPTRVATTGYETKAQNTNDIIWDRHEVFNSDGSIKQSLGDVKVIATHKGVEADKSDYYYVLAEKTTEAEELNNAKALLQTAKDEIAGYKKKGYTITKEVTESATFTVGDDGSVSYTEGEITVTVKKTVNGTPDERTYKFTQIDDAKVEVGVNVGALRTELFKINSKLSDTNKISQETVNGESNVLVWTIDLEEAKDNTGVVTNTPNYTDLNRVKYAIESNIAKYDAYVEDDGTDAIAYVYAKGGKNQADKLVMKLTITNFKKGDKEQIFTIPQNGDIASHWAKDQIIESMIKGEVVADAKFRPEDGITRAEFAKMLCTIIGQVNVKEDEIITRKTFEADKTYKETFHDVPNNEWYTNYIGFLQSNGVVQGDGVSFRPNDKITRQEVAVMVSNALNGYNLDDHRMVDTDKDNVKDTHQSISKSDLKDLVDAKLADASKIETWADDAVYDLVMKKNKVINGDGKNFNPTRDITRAESLVMVQRAVDELVEATTPQQ